MRHALLLFVLLALTGPAPAQVNIEVYRQQIGVNGDIGLQFGGSTGNADFFAGGGAANISYGTERYTLLAVAQGLLGFQGSKRFSNLGLVHLRFTWTRPLRFQPEAFVQTDYARSRKLVFRALSGGGLRTLVNQDTTYAFSFGNSLMWEYERLDLLPTAVHPHRTSTLRSSNYFNLRIRKAATLTLTAYYQFRPSEVRDTRILGNLQIRSRIAGPLDQETTLRYRWDNRPPEGIQEHDLALSTSFSYRF